MTEDSNKKKVESDLGAFAFLKVGVKPQSEGADNNHFKPEKAAGLFLIPIMAMLAIPFLIIYKVSKSDNPVLFLGFYFIIFSLIELKLGVAFSINPLGKFIGNYVYYKNENKNMFEASILGYMLLGVFFVIFSII